MKTLLKLVLICSITVALNAQGSVYMWHDDANQVHYSNTPPKDRDYTQVDVAPSPPAPEKDRTQIQQKTQDVSQKMKAQSEEQDEQNAKTKEQQEINEIKAKNCKQAKKYLEQLESRPRVRITRKNGQTDTLTPEQREMEIQETKLRIQENCEKQ